MNWYRDYKEQWKEIIETVAAEEHRTTQMVEKDTIQSMILSGISQSDLSFVFKGGTSLSKAYGLIDRFSEDIDLSMNHKPTEGEKKQTKSLILNLAENLGLILTNPEDIQSKHSYNKYVFEYDSLFSDIPLELIVETSFFIPSYPSQIQVVYSFIGRFCEGRGIEIPVNFNASVVKMPVQSLERTFVDKVFAVCDYRLQDMQDRDSRHLYDIAKLMPHIVDDYRLRKLIIDVRKDRMSLKNNLSARPEHDIHKMLQEIIQSHFYEADYNNVTKKLLYENVSYDEAVENGIAKIVKLGLFEKI